MTDEMIHVERLNRSIIKITPQRLNLVRDLSTTIAFVVNLIILIFYKYEPVDQDDGSSIMKPVIDNWADITIKVLGGAQIFTSVLLLVMWCIN